MLLPQGRGGNFDTPQFRAALAFYVHMFDRGWAPRMSETQISNVWDEFSRGFFSFYISGPWNIGNFRDRLPPERQHDWMTAPLPGPQGPGASIAGGSSLVLFHGTRHPREAWELVEFLSQPQNQEWFRLRTGDLPPRRTAWAQPALAADPYARAFRDQLERARPVPALPEWERIEDEMRLVSSLAVNHQLTVDEAAKELQRRADAILAKRRWVLERREARP
jgi:multiple sugar transport system substrate-binding protein